MSRRDALLLGLVTLLGLGLRLLVWRWRELQPLGGDEQEYLNAAVTLLRDRQYVELLFMRPPLYPVFLAASIVLVDSLVQNLRLVQAVISAATIPFVYLLALEVAWGVGRLGPASRRVALAAALLAALSYTLAANAAELLTETVFLFGLTVALWLIVRAGRTGSWRTAALAGLGLGALCLVRSVALPLVPLGAVWLLISAKRKAQSATRAAGIGPPVALALCALLVVLPWTARNYATYGGLILIDTTGAENLWLDNDPAGREAVKAQLYALGDDRLLRQQLGARNGLAAIREDPARFAGKVWGELLKFFALEHSDDMRARQAIWVRPADVWLRLALGDALWLLLLLGGSYGLARALPAGSRAGHGQAPRSEPAYPQITPISGPLPGPGGRHKPLERDEALAWGRWRSTLYALRSTLASPAWLLAPWALYVLLTTLIFHVELRYRLPLFPALLPFAALALAGGARRGERGAGARVGAAAAALVPALLLALTLLHVNYLAVGWQLGWKHWHLGRAEAALDAGDTEAADREAGAALERDPGSALARVAAARAALAEDKAPAALALLDEAVAAVPDHPLSHALRGDVRRLLGEPDAARADLAYEAATQQDLQAWGWEQFVTPPPARLDLGDGLDLGFVRGAHLPRPGDEGFRWTTGAATLRLAAPAGARELLLRLASGRPDGSTVPVEIFVNGARAGSFEVGAGWQEIALPLSGAGGELLVELRSPTFRPRAFDRASPDGRALGVKLDWAEGR